MWFPFAGAAVSLLAFAALGWVWSGGLGSDSPAAGIQGTRNLFLAVSLAILLLIVMLRRIFFSAAAMGRKFPLPDIDLAFRYLVAAHLVIWSLALVPAILGIAVLFHGGSCRDLWLFCGLSLFSLTTAIPTKSRIVDIVEPIFP